VRGGDVEKQKNSKQKKYQNMLIKHFRELKIYQKARKNALEIYDLSKSFPTEEKYSLTDQIRRSS
jgi:hypothetical protein